MCWGYNQNGECGLGGVGNIGDQAVEVPPPEVPFGDELEDPVLGLTHACAWRSGKMVCWGRNQEGQLGLGTQENLGDNPGEVPQEPQVGFEVERFALGGGSICALAADGRMRCWGSGFMGKLGLGSTDDVGDEPGEMPPPDVPVGAEVDAVWMGDGHMCVRTRAGGLRCWGDGTSGQLGTGISQVLGDEPGELPVSDVDVGAEVAFVAVGNEHTCVLDDVGQLRCFGRSDLGQLGYGDVPQMIPPAVVDVGARVLDLGAGADFNCAMLEGARIRCWGNGGFLGVGDPYDTWQKVPAELPDVQVF